ncbi:MAG TPA: D-alanine--D-alanine ligase family protein [Gaiella sp.]|nr:D-alanine--D-alanine ligase family protein [Gaiella sp.]
MNVGVIFGGASVEHDVSVITALQAMEALSTRHTVVPIYVTRSGRWLSGDTLRDLRSYQSGDDPDAPEISRDLSGGALRERDGSGVFSRRRRELGRVDVVLPATHGTYGEDGSLQGLLELCGIAYAGSSVAASAAAMNKALTKAVFHRHDIPTPGSTEVLREEWEHDRDAVATRIANLGLPVYVKPVSLGSSIGVSRCADVDEVREALELALELDRVALVEPSVEGAIEVNCAVLGSPGGELRTSATEQPVTQDDLLSFDDKYLRGGKDEGMKGAERIIPAPIADEQTERVHTLAKQAFAALGCAGVARVDFLVDAQGTVLVNEVNTIPGSFSFYLWEPAGLRFPELLDQLLDIALSEHEKARSTTRTFASALLATHGRGAKTKA